MKTPKPTDRPAGATAPESGADPALAEAEATPSKPAPEPMTPERVLEWNAYYDLFVAGFALLLCFVAAATIIDNAALWSHLRAGQLIDRQGGPITAEPFSYAVPEGTRWVDVPWLFQWASYRLHELGRGLAETLDRPLQAEQFAAGMLVAVHAMIRTLAALLLLLIRRPGPGLWWAAITTALALGIVASPLGGRPIRLVLGGMVGMGSVVSPTTWGLLLLVLLLLLLHWSYNLGRRGALFAAIPLFALWANVDESFAIGLILLAAAVVGSGIRAGRPDGEEARAPGLVPGLVALGLSALACLANPSTVHVYAAGFGNLLGAFGPAPEALMQDQLTLLPFGARGERSRALFFGAEYPKMVAYYVALVGLGLGSFLLNRRRLDLGRLLTFLAAAALAGLLWRLQDVLAIVLATCLALNGQEWYRDTFGTRGRLGVGWRAWSVGGRLATLGLLTLAILGGLTGYGKRYGEPPFGFGVEADRFAFEAADFLRDAPIEGRVMNLRLALGDALNWRSFPSKRSFVDSRLPRSAAPDLLAEYDRVRRALADGDVASWREILDRHGVSVLMVDLPSGAELRSRLTEALDASPDWQIFYDDGLVMLYGRLDRGEAVSQADRDYFRSRRLDAEAIAFGRGNPPRPFDRPPQPTDVLDRFSNARALAPVQPHVLAARRWLERGVRGAADPAALPGIASCLLAIQECRDALAVRPDDPDAFFVLSIAYRYLAQQEADLLVAAADPGALSGEIPGPLAIRQQQRMAALSAFLRTVPKPPSNPDARIAQRGAHIELAGLYESAGILDLTRDELGAALELSDTSEVAAEAELSLLESIRRGHEALSEQVERIRVQLEEAELEGQADSAQLGMAAASEGLAGLAVRYLTEAEQSGIGLATVRLQLVDLLCDVGQPDRALTFLGGGDEMSLSSGPGTAQFRQGRVYFLMGDYRTAAGLWRDVALPQLRSARSQEALQTASLLMSGQAMAAVQTALNVPGQLAQQADWDYLLGLCQLEGGFPAEAGAPFFSSLELDPELPARPIAVHYLERLGLEPPPPPSGDEADATEADATEPEPTEPEPTEPGPPSEDEDTGDAPGPPDAG